MLDHVQDPTHNGEKADKDYEFVISKIRDIPAVPLAVTEILDIAAEKESSVDDLAKAISKDQSIASMVLRVANSAFYGLSAEVGTIPHATVVLGFSKIRNIAITASVFQTLHVRTKGTFFNRLQFFEHSTLCGLAAEMMTKAVQNDKGELLTAGLIHDVGKVILDIYFPAEFHKIVERVDSDQVSMEEAELDTLGVSHADLGRVLLKKWKFPESIIMAVGHHHRPWDCEEHQDIASIIYFANILCKINGYSSYCREAKVSVDEFLDSEQAVFLNKKGFDINHDSINHLSAELREIISRGGSFMFFG
jgi:putative nucleotidyltransferase with HDIG domain